MTADAFALVKFQEGDYGDFPEVKAWVRPPSKARPWACVFWAFLVASVAWALFTCGPRAMYDLPYPGVVLGFLIATTTVSGSRWLSFSQPDERHAVGGKWGLETLLPFHGGPHRQQVEDLWITMARERTEWARLGLLNTEESDASVTEWRKLTNALTNEWIEDPIQALRQSGTESRRKYQALVDANADLREVEAITKHPF